jgi:phospholipase/carboxylesterase
MQTTSLWLEMPPISGSDAKRLLIFFHGAGSDAGSFAPVALHWHFKFPSAVVTIMDSELNPATGLPAWLTSIGLTDSAAVDASCKELIRRVRSAQQAFNLGPDKTMIIAQGASASIVLEALRREALLTDIAVTYGGRFATTLRPDEQLNATVHLIHGELDAQVPLDHAKSAVQGLVGIGADATLDILVDTSHLIDQEMINVGTARAMQTVFRGRRKQVNKPTLLH